MPEKKYEGDVVIIGGGLAGLVTAFELIEKNKRVILLERDREDRLGGLAKESFGGVMMVGTPLQQRSGIPDTPELAFSDWLRFAEFSPEDQLPRQWAETYVNTSREMIYEWFTARSVKFLPLVNWTERGIFQPGNTLPRWHIAWGTGFGMMESVIGHLDAHPLRHRLTICCGHRVERLERTGDTVTGCSGKTEASGESFSAKADIVVAAAGGICGGDLSCVRKNWYPKWKPAPETLLNGSHRYADGLIHEEIRSQGGRITHLDKQWHYAAGIRHPRPDRENHGLSLVPPRSALWVNALGERIGPVPLVGNTDTRHLVQTILDCPGQYSWQVMNRKIALKELAVSGSEYMTAFKEKSKFRLVKDLLFGNRELVERLTRDSSDIVTASSVDELVEKMNRMEGNPHQVDGHSLSAAIDAYDGQIDRGQRFFTDDQLRRIASYRKYRGDRIRLCRFQKINDPAAMPLIAIREFILSRKSLGGVQTDLDCRVLDDSGHPIPGLFAVGETAGFGGGGIHGKRSLEGTFLGSCVLTGRRAAAAIVSGG